MQIRRKICNMSVLTMSQYFYTLSVIFLLTAELAESINEDINIKVQILKNRATGLYGEKSNEVIKLWEYELEDRLAYPRGDKHKLSHISDLWTDYYACCVRAMDGLTASGGRPGVFVTAYVGAVARLPCGVCVSPEERSDLAWEFSESLENLTFTPMEDKETAVREEDGAITLYHVREEDAGVYQCQIGRSVSGPVVLEVIDYEENYTVVKPPTSRGPYPSPFQPLNEELTLFTVWAPWSECSRCARVGRRRRYGLCYVGLSQNIMLEQKKENKLNHQDDCLLLCDKESRKLFEVFPGGVPCRSGRLPARVRKLPAVRRRNSEIMIGMCKVPCETVIFELRSLDGRVFERTNNSGGVYSLAQRPPPQPPRPPRDIVFATRGKPLVLRCPGTTLRDVPATWRAGTKYVVPRTLDKESAGRVHIDARDHLVFAAVLDGDANLYSCWQSNNLAGTVRLEVWSGSRLQWNTHLVLLMAVGIAAMALRCALRVLRRERRRVGRVRC